MYTGFHLFLMFCAGMVTVSVWDSLVGADFKRQDLKDALLKAIPVGIAFWLVFTSEGSLPCAAPISVPM